jgi:hypothetical protein
MRFWMKLLHICDQDSSSGCHVLTLWMINLIVLFCLSEYVHCCIIAAVRETSVNMNCLPASQFLHIKYVLFALSDSAGVVLLIHHCLMHNLFFMCISGRFKFRVVKDKVRRSMFWILRKEATGRWRKLCIDDFHNYCYAAVISVDQIKKPVIIWCAVHVLRVRNASRILVGKPDRKSHWGNMP